MTSFVGAILDFSRDPSWTRARCERVAHDIASIVAPRNGGHPSEARSFGDSEAMTVVQRLGDALSMALHAQQDGHAELSTRTMALVSQAAAIRPAELASQLVDGPVSNWESFRRLIAQSLERAATCGSPQQARAQSPVDPTGHVAVAHEALLLLQRISDMQRTKETCGEAFMALLTAALVFPEQSFMFYRYVATCLINLLKGSKDNKTNFRGVETVARALVTTGDFFLQMQLAELLFRLSRTTKGLVETAVGLPPLFQASIPRLPNDATLLTAMARLLDTYNADVASNAIASSTTQRNTIYKLDAACVAIGGPHGASWVNTAVYFSPLFAVIMLPGRSGENATVLYSTVRSVRISKDQRLALRLHEPPLKLKEQMRVGSDVTDGADTIFLQLTAHDLKTLKDSAIHGWMVSAMASTAAAAAAVSRGASAVPTAAAASVAATRPDPPASLAVSGANAKSAGAKRSRSRAAGAVGPPSDDGPAAGRPPAAPTTLFAPLSQNTGVGADRCASTPRPAATGTKRASSPSKPPRGGGGALPPGGGPGNTALVGPSTVESGDMMEQLRHAIRGRVERHREACRRVMSDSMSTIQDEVDRVKIQNGNERDAFQRDIDAELSAIAADEALLKEKTSRAVSALNGRLLDLQSLLQVGTSQRVALAASLEQQRDEMQRIAKDELTRAAVLVDERCAALDAQIDRFESAANPLRFLANQLSKQFSN